MNTPFHKLLRQHAERVIVVPMVERAVGTGRRKAHLRTATAGGTAVVLAAALVGGYLALKPTEAEAVVPADSPPVAAGPFEYQPSPADDVPAPTRCVMNILPVPDGLPSIITAMDPTGAVIAGRSYPAPDDGTRQVLLWRDGQVEEVNIPGNDQSITGINSSGTAVGQSWHPRRAWLYQDGAVTEIPNLTAGNANDINDNGDIVGTQEFEGLERPFVLPAGTDKPIELKMPAGANHGSATAISNDGYIVGYYDTDDGYKPYIWTLDGAGRDLPMPEGIDPDDAHSYAGEISGGWVTGYFETIDTAPVGIRWNLAENTAEILDLNNSAGINAQGWVAGSYDDDNGTGIPALLTDEGRIDLDYITDEAFYLDNNARAVSEDGTTVAGVVSSKEGNNTAVSWTCQ